MTNYWVVGAMFAGQKDQLKKFIRRGYWQLGWKDAEQPVFAKRRDSIKPGDRIAIKKLLGQGSKNIEIRTLGIVRENDRVEKRIYIDWLVRDLTRIVPIHGLCASIHGPFTETDRIIKDIFFV